MAAQDCRCLVCGCCRHDHRGWNHPWTPKENPVPQQQPSIGRIVHVPVDPATSNGAVIAPAVITRVWSDTTVNVRVLHDGESITWRTSAVYRENLDNVEGAASVWTWPERV